MKRKTLLLLRSIISTLLIIAGVMGLWYKYPLIAASVLLLGITLLPSLYGLMPVANRYLPCILPLCCVILTAVSLFSIPPKTEIVTAFPPEPINSTYCYVKSNGTRYHLSRDCSGVPYTRIKTKRAILDGYTPCSTCAKNVKEKK